MIHKNIIDYFETWSPQSLAYEWDNVGIQIGNHTDQTKGVLVTLDVLENVIDEAIEKNVNLIIAHHPLLFQPIKSINTQTPLGRTIQKALKNDITIYAAHTNFDVTNNGMNDLLARQLKLTNVKNLVNMYSEKLFKFIVFVPNNYVDEIREAINEAGAGIIGNYSDCTFSTNGTGSFRPLDGSQPFIGDQHKISKVSEVKLETIVSEKNLTNLISSVQTKHPYEEMAYDYYLLQNKGKQYGLGRIGEFKHALSFAETLDFVKNKLDLASVRYVGNLNKKIKKVAILGGSGEKFLKQAINAEADVYISGDFTFHPSQEAMQSDIAIIDAGHYIEEIMKVPVQEFLKEKFRTLNIYTSKINTNPFKFST